MIELDANGELASVRIVVPGRPVPKSRPRVTRNRGVYSDARQVVQEAAIGWALRAEIGHRRFDGPVAVEAYFFFANRRHGDGDNLLKLVMDAANNVVWRDDKQALKGSFEIDYDDTPRTVVCITARPKEQQ